MSTYTDVDSESQIDPTPRTESCVLLELPDGLFNNILLDWLRIQDVAPLDSALCNTTLRPQFLRRIDNDNFGAFFNTVAPVQTSLDWLLSRKLRVKWMHIWLPHVNEVKVRALLQLMGEYLRTLDFGGDNVFLVPFHDIASNCPNIKVLRMRAGTIDESLREVLLGLKHLQELRLSQCSGLEAAWFHGFRSELLQVLKISTIATDEILVAVAEMCPNLQWLEIAFSMGVTDNGVIAVARGCVHLELFNALSCSLITDKSIEQLAVHCRLNRIYLAECSLLTDLSFQRLAAANREMLEELVISGCEHVTDKTFESLIKAKKLPCMWKLWCGYTGITDFGLLECVLHFSGMTSVLLDDCFDLTDESITRLIKVCKFLRTLSMQNLDLSDKTVDAIAMCAYSLEHLNVIGIDGFSEEGYH